MFRLAADRGAGARSAPMRRPLLRWLLGTLVCGVLLSAPSPAGEPLFGDLALFRKDQSKGSSGRFARREAERMLPLENLDPHARAKVQAVVDDLSVYRRMPMQSIETDAEMYGVLLEHPELIVGMWRAMGVTQVQLEPIAPGVYHGDDGAGTVCRIEVLHRDPRRMLIYADGSYSGAYVSRSLAGQAVMLLTSTAAVSADAAPRVDAQLHAFVRLPQASVEFIAKTLNPVLGKIADHNFGETTGFISSLGRAAQSNPGGLMELTDRLDGVDVEARRAFAAAVLNYDAGAGRTAVVQAGGATVR